MKKTKKTISAKPQTSRARKQAAEPEMLVTQHAAPKADTIITKPAAQLSTPTRAVKAAISLELVNPNAHKVCVAGTFNGWKPEATPLQRSADGRWMGNLAVNPGRYEYLFVVDGQWLPDPNAKETVQNPFGGRNSVLSVSA